MKPIIYANRPWLQQGMTEWLEGILDTEHHVVLVEAPGDGQRVLSVQPKPRDGTGVGGAYETRAAGTYGQWEVHVQSGSDLIYNPMPGEFYVIPWKLLGEESVHA